MSDLEFLKELSSLLKRKGGIEFWGDCGCIEMRVSKELNISFYEYDPLSDMDDAIKKLEENPNKRITELIPKFVKRVPDKMAEGVLYISKEFNTAIHLCCCGCGNQTVTPTGINGWALIKDGDLITLHPSIGNWNFECRSHYWIRKNKVEWCES